MSFFRLRVRLLEIGAVFKAAFSYGTIGAEYCIEVISIFYTNDKVLNGMIGKEFNF
ncbi:hypothetical protein MRBL20_000034 [Peribacillus frigoritolerans]